MFIVQHGIVSAVNRSCSLLSFNFSEDKLQYLLAIQCFRLTAPSGVITDGSGNYTTDNKCTWLIDADASSSSSTSVLPVRLKFEEFITECSWDHLYIFDGSSVYDPLIAVFR